MPDTPHYTITKFGFDYGSAKVVRAWSHKGHVGIMIRTGKRCVTIRVTPGGLIRIGDVEKDWKDGPDDA